MARKEILIRLNEGKDQSHVLGFVFLKEGGTYKDLREEIVLDSLISNDFVFLGGSRMLPVGAKQEERWTVDVEEVTTQLREESESPCKRQRVNSEGASNELEPSMEARASDLHVSSNGMESTRDDVSVVQDVPKNRLKSLLAISSEIKRWERDIKNAKEKLKSMGRHDRFELMSKDKEGKALFQIWCEECECSYGQGGHDTLYNFTHSHIKSLSHLRAIGLDKKGKQRNDMHGVTPSLEEIKTQNKQKIDEAMFEISSFGSENDLEFQLVSETIGDYTTLSKVFIRCPLDDKWLPLFPKTGSLRLCMIEHMKSKLHVKAATKGDGDELKKVGRPSKVMVLDKNQRNLIGFFKPIQSTGT